MDKKYYYQSKFISAFLTGGLVVTIPLCLDILLCSMVRPSLLLMPEASNTFVINGPMFSRLYYRHSFLYVVVYMLIIFIFSGLFAVLGTGIGRYSTNRFIPLVFPFILCLFQSTVVGALQHPEYAIDNFITPAQRVAGITFPVVFAEAVLLFFACVGIYWYGAKKDEAL